MVRIVDGIGLAHFSDIYSRESDTSKALGQPMSEDSCPMLERFHPTNYD